MTVEIGLTGSIGAGKSTVARLLERRGAVVIDADALARRALEEPEVVGRIRARFGAEVAPGGTVERAALADRVFGDDAARRDLEAIVHPRVRAAAQRASDAARSRPHPPPLIVHDVPLLFESGRPHRYDAVLVVDAPLEARVARVVARSGWTPEQVRARDAAQMPAARKRALADVVIDNGADLQALEAQVDAAWPRLLGAGDASV
jgi:dephospho-CoA kinase